IVVSVIFVIASVVVIHHIIPSGWGKFIATNALLSAGQATGRNERRMKFVLFFPLLPVFYPCRGRFS
ncbi:MAG: hypothetical protein JXA03_08045, partial [Bacteroidales bacterium]|nr:hypothetical protein [Bacteroidales bacterium]